MEKSLARYLRYHRARGSSPKTLSHHDGSIRLFVAWCRQHDYPTDVQDLTADMVREWMTDQRDRALSDSTVATRLRSLKAFTAWLADEEWIPKNPLKKIKMPREADTAKELLSPGEVDKLLTACSSHQYRNGRRDYAIILALYSTGLRAAELLALRVADIDYGRGLITVRRGKGGKGRVVPLGSKVDRAIDRYLAGRNTSQGDLIFLTDDGAPMSYVALRQMLRRRGDMAGVKANAHKFRHSFAVAYLRGGGKLETLRSIMGHSTFDLTLHYARLAGVDIAEAHERADPARLLRSR